MYIYSVCMPVYTVAIHGAKVRIRHLNICDEWTMVRTYSAIYIYAFACGCRGLVYRYIGIASQVGILFKIVDEARMLS